MDLSKELKRKQETLKDLVSDGGIYAALRHIEIAERWFERARVEGDEDLFNDVIYRTNQAFEGMLKEAYTVLGQTDASNLTPHQIEQKLIAGGVFSERVTDLFRNYRQEWRNKSTHNHNLFFNAQEALLAIVSISAFSTILLDQIIEFLYSEKEKSELKLRREAIDTRVAEAHNKGFGEEIVTLLKIFTEELVDTDSSLGDMREVELSGRLTGFVEFARPHLKVIREPTLTNTQQHRMRPDLILTEKDERVVVELKGSTQSRLRKREFLERGQAQLLGYLQAAGIETGILFAAPYSKRNQLKVERKEVKAGERTFVLYFLYPE